MAANGILRPQTVGAVVDGKLMDLQTAVPESVDAVPVDFESHEALAMIRHSTAHVMADAVQRLFPGTKVTIGPSIETGFYYDFDRPDGSFTDQDLEAIESEMREIIAGGHDFRREVTSREEARRIFEAMGESYKLEILDGIPEGQSVILYRHGEWVDLCAGPHLPSTRFLKAFKLLSAA